MRSDNVIVDVFDLPGNERGPIDEDALTRTIEVVQERLDLLTVLRVRYGCSVEAVESRWRTTCFLPSTVEGFGGSCAEQDALSEGGQQPQNLWVSEGDTTRVWRCFSCGRRGDVVDLLEAGDGLKRIPGQVTSLSAVRVAAKLAGVAYILDGRLPGEHDDPSDLVNENAPRRVAAPKVAAVDFARARSLNALAAKHWRAQLKLGPGYRAREELARRGVTDEQAARFVLGYAAKEWRELVELLPTHARAEAQVLGLIGKTRQGEYYDRYRDRLIFPYCEPARDGKPEAVTGFAGRDLSEDADNPAPKWFNSRNVEGVWKKSAALLGLLQARQTIERTKADRCVVGEGGWEVLAYDRIDVACVGLVASPMTLDHAHLIAEVLGVSKVTIASDGDVAGRRGALTSALSLLRYGFDLDSITVVDPDDEHDPGKWGETSEGTDKLRATWADPLSLQAFIEARQGIAREQQKRALLGVLPTDLAAHYAQAWGLRFDAEIADEDMTPAARFVEALKRAPELTQCLDGEDVRAVLAADSLAACMVRDMSFGQEHAVSELPPQVRRAWLELKLADLERQLATHEKSDPFGEGGTHEDFQRWYERGEQLRAEKVSTRKAFASCKA